MPITTDCQLILRPDQERIAIAHVNADGTWDQTKGCIDLLDTDFQYAGPAGGGNIKASGRRLHYTATDGTTWRISIVATAKVSDATDDGHSDAGNDIYLGGGAAIQGTITALYGATANAEYFQVTPTSGAPAILVTKSYAARGGTTGGPDGATPDNGRVVSGEGQVMIPPFATGQTVSIAPIDHTGVYVSGVELTWIEVATEREWCHPVGTTVIGGVTVLTP